MGLKNNIMKNLNKWIWGIAILGGGYLLYDYTKKHFMSTRSINLLTLHQFRDTLNTDGFDNQYLQHWAEAIKNKQTTFIHNGLKYNVNGGKVIK